MDRDDLFKFLESKGGARARDIGRVIAVPPLGQDEVFNFTLPKGVGTNLWYGLMSWLGDKGYTVKKIDETLDISHVDQGYHGLTQRQKDEMEGKIRQSLVSISQSIADYELLEHDLRKYGDFLKMIKTGDEHSLRAVFVDEVDISTGANSIKQMVGRWPTMISDFTKMGDSKPGKADLREVTDVDRIKDGLGISRAEAVILSTKQRLYLNWKNDFFGRSVEERYRRLLELKNSRKKSIDEYREWIKPTIAKYKLLKEGLSSPGVRKATFSSAFSSPGQAISSNTIEVWGWQPLVGIVGRTGTVEQKNGEFSIEPYDEYTKKSLVFAKKKDEVTKRIKDHGLKAVHPWITEKWVKDAVDALKKDSDSLKPDQLYYAFIRIKYERAVMKLPDGTEIEDVTYMPKFWFYSQNALLVLLLHQKALEEEFEGYIDQIIGISNEKGTSTSTELEEKIKEWRGETEEKKKEKNLSFDWGPLRRTGGH
ncbi:MAG: hypothetical protein ACP5E4_02055 [Candidatus Aenigmatarchaeota archaeon]